MKTDFEALLSYQNNIKYLSKREICYDTSYPFCYDPHRYEEYLRFKEEKIQKNGSSDYVSLPLFSFNSPLLFYSNSFDLQNARESYLEANHLLMSMFSPSLPDVSSPKSEVLRSLLFSEVEGSLNLENVPTTRKRVKELFDQKREPVNRNDQIIKNMALGIDFVLGKPAFNKDNLRKLYGLLSEGCLDPEDRLKEGNYYRDDEVEVDGYPGCPFKKLDEAMNSLFSFVNQSLLAKKNLVLLPHLTHYALVYYHPYFDYNGRMARMLSFWISLLEGSAFVPLFSEAINGNKNQYYLALEESRNNHNDLTYFLLYLLRTSASYCFLYRDIENLVQEEKNQGITPLSATEQSYLRKIVIKARGKFNQADFLSFAGIEISKQGGLKILNHFVDLKILKASTIARAKFFEVNKSFFPYAFHGQK